MNTIRTLSCPRCDHACASSMDICPMCRFDLRWHKKSLGVQPEDSLSRYEELLVKLVSPETSVGDTLRCAEPSCDESTDDRQPSLFTSTPSKNRSTKVIVREEKEEEAPANESSQGIQQPLFSHHKS